MNESKTYFRKPSTHSQSDESIFIDLKRDSEIDCPEFTISSLVLEYKLSV